MGSKSVNNIFMAFTPYHVLLAYALALGKAENNTLFIVSEFPDADVFASSLRHSKVSPFSEVFVLPGTHRKNEVFLKITMRRKNVRLLKKYIENRHIQNVFVGNDSRIEAQAALCFGKARNKQCKGIYVEDGTAAYRTEKSRKDGLAKILFSKAMFGWWYEENEVPGTSSWIDQSMVIFPELVRIELRDKEVSGIPREDFLGIRQEPAFINYLSALGLNPEMFYGFDVLFISNNSEMEKRYPAYQEVARSVLHLAEDRKLRLVVKYHPRELAGDFLGVKDRENMLLLPGALPMELFYVLSPTAPKLIIGDYSTALLTARWLLDSPRIVSTALLSDYHDEHIFETFKKINIRLVHTKEELEGIIAATKD